MDNTEFPKEFPDVGGQSFRAVRDNPKYNVFCEFVRNRMENCTGLFLEFQRYLNKHAKPEGVPKRQYPTGD